MQEDAPSLSNVDSLEAEQPLNEISQDSHGQSLSPASIETKTPDGQLKRDFRLGGRPSTISSRLISFAVDLSLDLIDRRSILPWNLTAQHHGRNESIFSIAFISSYGAVIHSGSLDPFEFGMRIRPASVDVLVNDTLSCIMTHGLAVVDYE